MPGPWNYPMGTDCPAQHFQPGQLRFELRKGTVQLTSMPMLPPLDLSTLEAPQMSFIVQCCPLSHEDGYRGLMVTCRRFLAYWRHCQRNIMIEAIRAEMRRFHNQHAPIREALGTHYALLATLRNLV